MDGSRELVLFSESLVELVYKTYSLVALYLVFSPTDLQVNEFYEPPFLSESICKQCSSTDS